MSKFDIKKVENFIGGLKFAVILISIFTIAMIVGTFEESYHGADYANRLIYKSPWFMLMQFGFFLCVFMAALLRLPPRKNLYGFYTIHTGIIIIIAGSFITYYAGIDGNITLPLNTSSRHLVLPDDILEIKITDYGNPDNSKSITYPLPFKAKATRINESYEGITLLDFYPFSDPVQQWQKPNNPVLTRGSKAFHSSHYMVVNDFVTQELTLTLHPEAKDFESNAQLGPLSLHYLPFPLWQCFQKQSASGYILWDQTKNQCQTIEERGIQIQTTSEKKKFLAFKADNKMYTFFPDFSPWPVKNNKIAEKLEFEQSANFRIFNKGFFEKGRHVFLFGEALSFFDGDEWQSQKFESKEFAQLPWMNLRLQLLKHSYEDIPVLVPEYVRPIQDGGQLIKGKEKALSLKLNNELYWLRSEKPLSLFVDGKGMSFNLTKRSLKLPFELTLTRFKMDKDPGTNNPASYESFANLFTENGMEKHHIYMNNPLKFGGFTFYQASYFQDQAQQYGSVLSVNFDPGRIWKYLGSLILVLGTMWHYYLTRGRKKKKPKSIPDISIS